MNIINFFSNYHINMNTINSFLKDHNSMDTIPFTFRSWYYLFVIHTGILRCKVVLKRIDVLFLINKYM